MQADSFRSPGPGVACRARKLHVMRVEAEGGEVRIGIKAHPRLVPALRAVLQQEQRSRDERAAAAGAPPCARPYRRQHQQPPVQHPASTAAVGLCSALPVVHTRPAASQISHRAS